MQESDADGLDSVEKHLAAGIGPAWGRDLRLVSPGDMNSRITSKSSGRLTGSVPRCTKLLIPRTSMARVSP